MEREHRKKQEQEHRQGSVQVRMHPLNPQAHELTKASFTRYFPDMATYERVKQHFSWDYTAIEVWTREGERWQPSAEHTIYSSLWSGDKITDPLPGQQTERR